VDQRLADWAARRERDRSAASGRRCGDVRTAVSRRASSAVRQASRGGFDPLPGVVILELRGAQVAESRCPMWQTAPLRNKRASGSSCRGMCVILALLAMEVALGVAPAAATTAFAGRRFATVLRHQAFHASPGFDQRAVDREVLARKLANLRQVQHTGKELGGDVTIEQSVPVLAEHSRVSHRIVRRQPDEPAEQQVIFELLHLCRSDRTV
jgi:hypothetical protein